SVSLKYRRPTRRYRIPPLAPDPSPRSQNDRDDAHRHWLSDCYPYDILLSTMTATFNRPIAPPVREKPPDALWANTPSPGRRKARHRACSWPSLSSPEALLR